MNATLVHPDNVAEWGDSIGDRALGQAIYANPKLKARAAYRMAETFGIVTGISAPNAAPSAGSLMSLSASARSQAIVIESYLADQERFVMLAGLVRMGKLLRKSVTPELFQALAQFIDKNDLKLAAKVARAFDGTEMPRVDTSRIQEHIEMLGQETVMAWRMSLKANDRAKLDFSLGAADVPSYMAITTDDATEIMALLTAELQADMSTIGAK